MINYKILKIKKYGSVNIAQLNEGTYGLKVCFFNKSERKIELILTNNTNVVKKKIQNSNMLIVSVKEQTNFNLDNNNNFSVKLKLEDIIIYN